MATNLNDNDLFLVSQGGVNKTITYSKLAADIDEDSSVTSVTGGDGITVTPDSLGGHEVEVDLASKKGLEIDNNQLAVKLGAGVEFDADGGISVNIDSLTFKGNIDLTDDSTRPASAAVGDTWTNNGSPEVATAWADRLEGVSAGDDCNIGDLVICKEAATSQTTGTYVLVQTGGVGGDELWIRNDASNTLSPAFSGDSITDIGNITSKGVLTIATPSGNINLKPGAGSDVEVGSYNDGVNNRVVFRSGATSNAQYWFYDSDNAFRGQFKFAGETSGSANALTANRTYTFPNKTGTIALLEDLADLGGGTLLDVTAGLGIEVDNTTDPSKPEVAVKFGATETTIDDSNDFVMPYDLSLLPSI